MAPRGRRRKPAATETPPQALSEQERCRAALRHKPAAGTVTGNEIQWTVTRETPNGTFSMSYTGTVEGNTMKGTAEGPMGKVDWKGERVKSQ